MIKILEVGRKNGTIMFKIINFKTQEAYSLYFQFTFKDPWWIPKYKPNYLGGKLPLYGWLFFYFGRITEGIIVAANSEDNIKIRDNKGNGYLLYTIEDRQMKDDIRKAIKSGKYRFEIKITDYETEIVGKEK